MMMLLADLAQLAIAGKNRVAGRPERLAVQG
jgi:hypothetical protein